MELEDEYVEEMVMGSCRVGGRLWGGNSMRSRREVESGSRTRPGRVGFVLLEGSWWWGWSGSLVVLFSVGGLLEEERKN